jgi:plasmid stabilization system protein ParE
MLPIDLLPGAHEDFNQSFNWYASKSPGVAERFTHAIDTALSEIAADLERLPRLTIFIAKDSCESFRFALSIGF